MGLKDRVIEVAYELKDRFTGQVSKVTGSFRKIENASDKSADKIELNNKRSADSFGLIAGAATKAKLGLLAVAAVAGSAVAGIGKWTAAAATQERAETKLATSLRNLTGASDDQIQALKDQAAALQNVTGYGDETTISAQAMLATFQLNASQIAALTPRLLDMAESARKAGKAETDLESIAIALGKAFTSGIGSLSRYGIAMDDAQKEAFKLADQQGKVKILTEVLDGNFGGLAAAVGAEYEGAVRKADAAHGDFHETLGQVFTQSAAWIKLINSTTKVWNSLSEAVKSSSKEIETVITGFSYVVTGATAVIRTTWNGLQITFKGVALAMVETAALVNTAFASITIGDLSKQYAKDAADMKRLSGELQESINDDIEDIKGALTVEEESFEKAGDAAEKSGKKIEEHGKKTKITALSAKDLEQANKNLEKSFDKATAAVERDAKALQKVRDDAKQTSDEYQDLIDLMRNGPEKTEGFDVGDWNQGITDARKALQDGDFDGALRDTERLKDMLIQMQKEGYQSDIVLTGMAMKLKGIAEAAAEADGADELLALEKSKKDLDEVLKKKQNLVEGPINIQLDIDSSVLDEVDSKMQEVRVIPVRYEVVGEVPGSSDGTDIARESAKRGFRL